MSGFFSGAAFWWLESSTRVLTSRWYCSGESSDMALTKATKPQISFSSWVSPKAGMPVILMPFRIIQCSSESDHSSAVSDSSGALGLSPFPISEGAAPGSPWQVAHMALKCRIPCRKRAESEKSGAGISFAWNLTERSNAVETAQRNIGECGFFAATL